MAYTRDALIFHKFNQVCEWTYTWGGAYTRGGAYFCLVLPKLVSELILGERGTYTRDFMVMCGNIF